MDTHLATKNDLKSSDSNSAMQSRRLVLELLITYSFCLLLSIGVVAFEFFRTYRYFGMVRPVWAYVLGGASAAILFLYTITSFVQLANRNWRMRSIQHQTAKRRKIIAVSLWGILFMSYMGLPFANGNFDLMNFVSGIAVGFFIAVIFFTVFGLTKASDLFGLKESQSNT